MYSRQQARVIRKVHQVLGLAREVHRLRLDQVRIQKKFLIELRQSVTLQRASVQTDSVQIFSRQRRHRERKIKLGGLGFRRNARKWKSKQVPNLGPQNGRRRFGIGRIARAIEIFVGRQLSPKPFVCGF